MTKEQKEQYEKIVATGRFTEEQLARLRAGFEKAPRQYDIQKSELHMEQVACCQQLEKIDPNIIVEWSAEDEDGDAYIYVCVQNFYSIMGAAKMILLNAMGLADLVTYSYDEEHDGITITLGFMDIISDPNKPENFTAN